MTASTARVGTATATVRYNETVKMEQIKKKMATLREEHDKALERAEMAENKLKDVGKDLDEVSDSLTPLHTIAQQTGVVDAVWPQH